MSIFGSRTIKVVEIPFDAPHTVTIQKLPGRHLEKARDAMRFASAEDLRQMGGLAFQRELLEIQQKQAEKAAEPDEAGTKSAEKAQEGQPGDPLLLYDRYHVVQKGIKAWTYDVEVTPESIDDLDDDAADFLAREILRLSKPALFQTAGEMETERKNG